MCLSPRLRPRGRAHSVATSILNQVIDSVLGVAGPGDPNLRWCCEKGRPGIPSPRRGADLVNQSDKKR